MRVDGPDVNLRAYDTRVTRDMQAVDEFYRPHRRMILLVHGYNVTIRSAVKVLGEFRRALAHFIPALLPDTFLCTWPGNWVTQGIRPLAYPLMLRNARDSALTLLEGIQKRYTHPSPPEELILIAHSLGCRLVLEMLAEMQAQGGRPPGMDRLIVVLMAAAVPIDHLQPGRDLHPGLAAANITVALHSEADRVLSVVFGAGQTVARDGWFPEAVGRRGNPPSAGWTHAHRMAAFDHGDYWNELESAEVICRDLGFVIRASATGVRLVMRKHLPERRLPMLPLLPG